MENIYPELDSFLTAVNCSYQQFDGGYFLLERTMKSSRKGFSSPLKTARKIGLRGNRDWSGDLQEDFMAACISVKIRLSECSKSTVTLPKGQPDTS